MPVHTQPTNFSEHVPLHADYCSLGSNGRNQSVAHQRPPLQAAQPFKQSTGTLQDRPKIPQLLRVHNICCKEIQAEDNEGPYFGVIT